MNNEVRIDALLPADMAAKAEAIGVKKANLDVVSMFALAVLAGAFVALGAIFATTVTAGVTAAARAVRYPPYSMAAVDLAAAAAAGAVADRARAT